MSILRDIALAIGYTAIGYMIATTPAHAALKENKSVCEAMGDAAEAVMAARQGGVPMVNLLPGARSNVGPSMVMDAYRHQEWKTKGMKDATTISFRHRWEQACINSTLLVR